MPNYRMQVTLASLSGRPEDVITNTYHWVAADLPSAQNIADEIGVTYGTDLAGQTHGLTAYYGSSIVRGGFPHKVRVYDLADPEPRVPLYTSSFGALTQIASTTSLPRETAVCLSYEATPVSGAIQARRRNRAFLGPLNSAATGVDATSGDLRPTSTFIADIIRIAQRWEANTDGVWSVHSTLSPVLLPVTQGWVDNALDTQRRRGVSATSRTNWT